MYWFQMVLPLVNTFLAKECANCHEKMPVTEKVCYCSGPITVVRLPLEDRNFVSYYQHRKWLALAKEKSDERRPS